MTVKIMVTVKRMHDTRNNLYSVVSKSTISFDLKKIKAAPMYMNERAAKDDAQ